MPLRGPAFTSWLTKWLKPKSLGERGEDAAARYLKRLGYQIVGRQVDLHVGELDIVAVDNSAEGGRTVVFIEVKTRTSDAAGMPTEAIDELRQQRLTRAALAYLKSHGLLEYRARFDVIAITWPVGAKSPTIEHIRDAFPAAGQGQFFA
ncbi:MAG: YraN family protein [Pirellulales bacterium]